jgi:transcriptional regulator with XRE-family HTH domain
MGQQAAGAYIQEVRSLRGLTRQQCANAIGLSDDRIEQFERARGGMGGAALLRLIRYIDASYEQTLQLLDDDTVPVDEARQLARAWVSRATSRDEDNTVPETLRSELWELALRQAGGDRVVARRLLLRALEAALE